MRNLSCMTNLFIVNDLINDTSNQVLIYLDQQFMVLNTKARTVNNNEILSSVNFLNN